MSTEVGRLEASSATSFAVMAASASPTCPCPKAKIDVAVAGRTADDWEGIRRRRAMAHPVGRSFDGQAGNDTLGDRHEPVCAGIVGWFRNPRELSNTCDPQAGFHGGQDHPTSSRLDRYSHRHAGSWQHGVVAALGFEGHLRSELGRQGARPGAGSDDQRFHIHNAALGHEPTGTLRSLSTARRLRRHRRRSGRLPEKAARRETRESSALLRACRSPCREPHADCPARSFPLVLRCRCGCTISPRWLRGCSVSF